MLQALHCRKEILSQRQPLQRRFGPEGALSPKLGPCWAHRGSEAELNLPTPAALDRNPSRLGEMHHSQYFCTLRGLPKHQSKERYFEEIEHMFEFQALHRSTTRLCVSCILLAAAAFFGFSFSAARAEAQAHTTDELRKMDQSVGELIRKVSPSVVQILVSGYGT